MRNRSWTLILAACLAGWAPLRALPAQNGEVVLLWSSLPGIAPGQTLRIVVGNLIGTEESAPVGAIVRLFDARGNVVAQRETPAIRPDALERFDFERSSIPSAGDPGTGRLQLRAEIEVRTGPVNKIDAVTIKQKVGTYLPVAVEVITTETGRTATTVKTYAIIDAWPAVPERLEDPLLVGFAPGEMIRYTLFLANGEPVRELPPLRLVIADEAGVEIGSVPYLRWPNGSALSVDMPRARFSAPGEPGTGRLQVRVHLEVNRSGEQVADPMLLMYGTLEIIEEMSGKTTAVASHPDFLWWPTGKSAG